MRLSTLPSLPSRSLAFLLIVTHLLPPSGVASGQVRDTLQADTSRVPVYQLRGLTVLVPRPVSTTGGASVVEMNLDSMVTMPAPTLEQVLREMPLIQIRRNSRGEAQPALRGGEDRQIAVLVDGIPLTLGWDHRTDLSVIPLTAAQRVNLIRGLSSVLHGPNVLGGVVEVDVARGAERQRVPRPLQVDMGLDHTGARSLGISGGALLESSMGDWVVRAGAGHQARDGFALPGGAGEEDGQNLALLTSDGDLRLNTDSERYDGFASVRLRSVGGAWLSMSTSGHTTERGVAPEAHVDDPRLWRYPAQSRVLSAVSGGTGQRTTSWGEGDLEASLGVDLGSYEIEEFASPRYRDVTGGESADDRTLTFRLLGDHSLGGNGELRGAFTFADVHHEEVLDGEGKSSYRQRLWSLGTEAEWAFDRLLGIPQTGATRFSAGVAVDGADTPETGDKPPLDRLWDWGLRVGATSLATDGGVLFHGAFSRRARFPALRELYSGALGRFVPNPDLKPEVMTGGELGFTITGASMELQAVGFHQRLSDGIVRSSVSTPEGKKYQRVNQDEVRSTGIELLAVGQVGWMGLSGDLTLQRVRGFTPDGDEVDLEYEPEIAGRVGTMLPLLWHVNMKADVRFLGKQYCENPEIGGLQSFDGYRNLDLRLSRGFSLGSGALSQVEAVLAMDNVTDGFILDQCGLPQPGRTLRVQLRVW
ncbi:TonB-dependent receptor plug domain-containing protein [Gemmatimonadota bacterium]